MFWKKEKEIRKYKFNLSLTGRGKCHHPQDDLKPCLYEVKYKERSTGKIFEINPKIDNPFYDTLYRKAFRSGEYILISGELPDKWK